MTSWTRLLPYARSEARGTVALVGLAVAGVALEALVPWPLKLVVDHVLADGPLPGAAEWIRALPGGGDRSGTLAWLAAMLLAVFLAVQAVQLARSMLQAGVSARMQRALAEAVFERLQALSPGYHLRARTGDLVRRVTHDTSCLPALITGALIPVFASLLALAVFFAIMWRLDRTLAVCAAGVALPMAILIGVLGPRLTSRAYSHHAAEGELWSVAEQTLTALPVVQGFAREEAEHARFRSAAARSVVTWLRSLTVQLQFRIGVDGCIAIGVALVMLIGGIHVLQGSIPVGTLIVFLSYLTALYAPLATLAYLSATVAEAAGSARRVGEVLEATEMVCEHPDALPLEEALTTPGLRVEANSARARGTMACTAGGPVTRPVRGSAAPPPRASARPRVKGEVRLSGVVFGYRAGTPVLRGANLEIRPGEIVALMGRSGAGKSTLAALIPRLYDPWEGCIRIDGVDIRQVTLSSLRARIALVLQDPLLLPMSVADNIAYGWPSATRAQIEQAARDANAAEFITELPLGFDTLLGERGATLSGGQRQRLSIARAFLKNAPIVVLDEPTSALDPETEATVMAAVQRLAAGRSTLLVAHRQSTAARADRIVTLADGRILDADSPAVALAREERA